MKDIIEIKLSHKKVLDCLALSYLKARSRALETLQDQAHQGEFSSGFFSGLNLIGTTHFFILKWLELFLNTWKCMIFNCTTIFTTLKGHIYYILQSKQLCRESYL